MPLLASPAVPAQETLLDKPAVAPVAEIPQYWRIHQVMCLVTGNPTLFFENGYRNKELRTQAQKHLYGAGTRKLSQNSYAPGNRAAMGGPEATASGFRRNRRC